MAREPSNFKTCTSRFGDAAISASAKAFETRLLSEKRPS